MNFKEFEELIKSGQKEIVLNEDVLLAEGEDEIYLDVIEINTEGFVIDGKNHTIDGKGMASILYIEAPNVTLKNIIFKNGYSEYVGGALSNYSNELMINHCQFIDNATVNCSDLYGGSIYNAPNSSIFIERSIFKFNGSDYGGAIYIDSDSNIELKGSIFEENCSEFDGGAIYNKGKLIVNDSIFNRNAAVDGGAIYNEKDLIIRNSIFNNNIDRDGYDIITENKDIILSDSNCNLNNNEK